MMTIANPDLEEPTKLIRLVGAMAGWEGSSPTVGISIEPVPGSTVVVNGHEIQRLVHHAEIEICGIAGNHSKVSATGETLVDALRALAERIVDYHYSCMKWHQGHHERAVVRLNRYREANKR